MISIRTVVCPVDFSPATTRQVDLAIDVCRAFGARLVLHHNVHDVSVGAAVGWMWHADHERPADSTDSIDRQLRQLVARVPDGIDVETCITRGAVTEGVLRVSDAAEADLVVLSAHTGKTADHASVIEYLLEHSNRSVLALHDPDEDMAVPKFVPHDRESARRMQSVLVPVNLRAPSHPQLEFAAGLARLFPLRLHLLHVIEPLMNYEGRDPNPKELETRLLALVPDDLRQRSYVQVNTGDTVPGIVQAARDLSASCIVMGEHTRVPVKKWLSHDTSRAVLHEAHCPVWYIPSVHAPGRSLSRFALSEERSILWGNV